MKKYRSSGWLTRREVLERYYNDIHVYGESFVDNHGQELKRNKEVVFTVTYENLKCIKEV